MLKNTRCIDGPIAEPLIDYALTGAKREDFSLVTNPVRDALFIEDESPPPLTLLLFGGARPNLANHYCVIHLLRALAPPKNKRKEGFAWRFLQIGHSYGVCRKIGLQVSKNPPVHTLA
jgi:hypothetical protein